MSYISYILRQGSRKHDYFDSFANCSSTESEHFCHSVYSNQQSEQFHFSYLLKSLRVEQDFDTKLQTSQGWISVQNETDQIMRLRNAPENNALATETTASQPLTSRIVFIFCIAAIIKTSLRCSQTPKTTRAWTRLDGSYPGKLAWLLYRGPDTLQHVQLSSNTPHR